MSASPPAASSSVCAMFVRDRLVLAEPLDQRLELGQRLGVLPVLGGVALHLGGAEQRASAPRSAVLRIVSLSNIDNTFNRRVRRAR